MNTESSEIKAIEKQQKPHISAETIKNPPLSVDLTH